MAEGGGAAISLNIGYVKSLPGILRVLQIILAIIVLICVSAAGYAWRYEGDGFIYFTAATALIYAIIFTVLFLLNVPSLLARLPWVIIILIANVIFTLFYFISFIIACVASSYYGSWGNTANAHASFGAAAFFTLLAMAAHAFDAFLMFRDFRGGSRGGSGAANMPPSQPTPS